MSTNDKVLVPKRPSVLCPNCGKEAYQRLAEDGESVLLLGKGVRFNVKNAEIRWECKGCGAQHTISVFQQQSPIKKSYNPRVNTRLEK